MTDPATDPTLDPDMRSWVPGADGHPDFPVQNLPHCVFSTPGTGVRGGMRIGDWLLDLGLIAPRLQGEPGTAMALAAAAPLNAFLAAGPGARRMVREAAFAVLTLDQLRALGESALVPLADATLHLPCAIGDYTDFYAGIHHAVKVGSLFRPDNPLLPNYKHVPIGYHGRASSVVPSGTAIHRPHGQLAGPDGPRFAPAERLDIELELGLWIGTGNAPGTPIPIQQAADHIAGYCLLNDWSARDIQAWEYQPLGPFLAKSFATSISPYVITPDALRPFRTAQAARPDGDPAPLPYLGDPADQARGALALNLEVWLSTAAMRAAGLPETRISASDARHLYWTPAQMVAHHSSNGCNLRPGDLFGSGTISGPTPGSEGSLLEATNGSKAPLTLPGGETRTFLQSGDRITLRAWAEAPGHARIGFGDCTGEIVG
ncbi:fumarylacetoacetase [Sandaracinobacteroides saxicola]|uniref:fumarylacetoacetase n=1 Tax=Sandaracinobacteroides saxicola TaxID=2759707 RepID=A0A7G5IEI8_9SPHN|nr:fumarylacetoacetase [Sandaracinobacteroides saxicola]QMW21780.1 fumarylacetoacetase [Sandaracinobacteroides saxicola]